MTIAHFGSRVVHTERVSKQPEEHQTLYASLGVSPRTWFGQNFIVENHKKTVAREEKQGLLLLCPMTSQRQVAHQPQPPAHMQYGLRGV